jgi:hypothetical protein
MSKHEPKLHSNQSNYFKSSFDLPNPGLRAYFEHVRVGNSDEYRTPFYKGKSVEEILDGWSNTLQSIEDSWPTLFEFENDLRKKVGPMSIMLPLKDRMKDIDSYYDSISLESKPISDLAIEAFKSEWVPLIGGLRLRSPKRTLDVMKKSTNSGSPYFTKRKDVIDKTVPFELVKGYSIYPQQVLGPRMWQFGAPAILGWRGQEGGPEKDDVKQRVVWMFPFAVNISELQAYQPLIESCQRTNLVPAWVSMDAVDLEITKLFDTKAANDYVICTDFSKFDQHFNSDMQSCAQECLSSIFARNVDFNKWLENTFPIKYRIPLAYDYGKVRFGMHGMASGSGGTNADETIAHRCLQHEAAINQGTKLNPHSMCLGDDGVLTYPGINVDEVMRTYSSHGQEMNKDKQYVSKHTCIYLRRWHNKDYRVNNVCVGVYSTYRALGRLAEQERFYEGWSKQMVALRQLSILENCKYHPLREKFVDYCIKGDKYRLGLDIPGFLDNIEVLAKEATDKMPDFLGYTKSLQKETNKSFGIKDWWIVKYLKSKA